MINDPECSTAGKHRDLDAAQVRKRKRALQNVMTAISHFTNPWRIPNQKKTFLPYPWGTSSCRCRSRCSSSWYGWKDLDGRLHTESIVLVSHQQIVFSIRQNDRSCKEQRTIIRKFLLQGKGTTRSWCSYELLIIAIATLLGDSRWVLC